MPRLIALALIFSSVGLDGCVGRNTVAPGVGLAGGGGAGGGQTGGVGGAMAESHAAAGGRRRLTNAEYAASVFALLGVDTGALVAGFPRDATQKLGFTVNDAQIVSSVLASQLDGAAQEMVAAARQSGQFDFLAPAPIPPATARPARAPSSSRSAPGLTGGR